jgi:hypothetical protein
MFSSKRSTVRRAMIYAAASAAAIATAGLLASPALASTTQSPWQQGQGFSLSNNYGNASGTITASQYGQYGQYGQGSVTVSGTVSSNGFGRGSGYRRGATEEVFLSGNSWQRGELIGSAGPGHSNQVSGSLSNTTSGTITLCAASQRGGTVRDCTSQSFTVSTPQPYPIRTPHPTPQPHPRRH